MNKNLILFIPAAVIISSCTSKKTATEQPQIIDRASLDSSYRPNDDFFEFVDAKWIKSNPIPADKGSFGSFHVLNDMSLATLKKVMEDASNANAEKGSNTQKVGDFWFSGMDTISIEKEGIKPLQPYLDKIDAIQNSDDIIKMTADMQRVFTFSPFSADVEQDAKNSAEQILNISQGGLGLPERDYYLRTDAQSKQLRDAYVMHIKKLLQLMGVDENTATANANTIMKMETQLAKASMDNVTLRDPNAIYHKMTVDEFNNLTPGINWNIYLTELKSPAFKSMNVAQPDFFKELNNMIKTVSVADWKVYMKYHLVNSFASYLSSDFEKEDFDFYSRTLGGIKQMQPRWKRVCETAGFSLGEALGQEYVKVAFSPQSKERMLKMINDLKIALSERINQLDWMSDSTKQLAQEKLKTFMVKVGYPDKWRDYSKLNIDRGPYVLNVMRSYEFEVQRNLDKIGQPVDKTEWGMTPQTVNAYYNPSNNEIVFPAAILQPPFYNPVADDAVNYGGIGAVIGHEMTHGFDDEGRQFDAQGNLKDWWTKEDAQKFKDKAQVLINQYNSYSPLDSMNINGELTLGENIADFGGLTVAYNAFMKTQQAKDNKPIEGFTPQQRFFISFARVWEGAYRDEAMRRQLLTNSHSPGKYRVNGVVTNMPEWYSAFNLKEGDKLYRPENERAKIW